MNRAEALIELKAATASPTHFLRWHFGLAAAGYEIPFAEEFISTVLELDLAMPGYASRTIKALGHIVGPQGNRDYYEQIMQRLMEVHVNRHLVSAAWGSSATFEDEPTAPGSRKNPEILVRTEPWRLGVEVKTAALLGYDRTARPVQAGGRILPPAGMEKAAGGAKNQTLPRDNSVKDFLVSADAKFAAFHKSDPDFFGLLVIVWDDFVQEAVTALLHPASGLLTPESFGKDPAGEPLTFPNVDAVVVLSHQQFVQRALAENGGRVPEGERCIPFRRRPHVFEWRYEASRPPVIVGNSNGKPLPTEVFVGLNVEFLSDEVPGAEYQPQDWTFWM